MFKLLTLLFTLFTVTINNIGAYATVSGEGGRWTHRTHFFGREGDIFVAALKPGNMTSTTTKGSLSELKYSCACHPRLTAEYLVYVHVPTGMVYVTPKDKNINKIFCFHVDCVDTACAYIETL